MAEGIHKRIQPDLVREIEGYSGGSFSEKMRAWRLAEVEQTLESVENLTGSDKPLTVDDLKEAIDERLDQLENQEENRVNDLLTVDDVEDAVSRSLERDLPEILRREMR